VRIATCVYPSCFTNDFITVHVNAHTCYDLVYVPAHVVTIKEAGL
jgi:hypothetical protein